LLPWVFDINFECVSLCYGGFRRKSSWKKCDKKSSFYVIVNVKKNSNIFKEISLWWGGYISENEISIEWVTSLHPFLWGVFILLVNFERIVTRPISKIVSLSSFCITLDFTLFLSFYWIGPIHLWVSLWVCRELWQ
jgi:hypothetical protein